MGIWKVDTTSEPGILHLELNGTFTVSEMQKFLEEHNRAVDAYQGQDYRVFCDIRHLAPLSPEAAALMEQAKSHSSSQPNFRGSAVWVATAVTALQHRRTSVSSGVISTELISDNEYELREHLAHVRRGP